MRRYLARWALSRAMGAALCAAAAASPSQAAVSLAGQSFVVTESASVTGCCGAPTISYSNHVLGPAAVGTVVGGLNGLYGIAGSVLIDPVAQRLWFTLSDSSGFASFSNWTVHLSFPDLGAGGEISALAFDPDVGLPLRFVSSSAVYNPTSIDLTFNGSPATRGSFSYAWRYQTQAATTASTSAVPEPGSWLLMTAGMGVMGLWLRRAGRRPVGSSRPSPELPAGVRC